MQWQIWCSRKEKIDEFRENSEIIDERIYCRRINRRECGRVRRLRAHSRRVRVVFFFDECERNCRWGRDVFLGKWKAGALAGGTKRVLE